MATQPTPAPGSGLTAVLAARVVESKWNDLEDDISERVKQCLLDWIAVTVAGASEPLVRILVEETADRDSKSVASLIGHHIQVSPLSAALINGAASHALDYDDVHIAILGHPSVAIMPGLLALAETRRASGRALITAFHAGYETACRVGSFVAPSHYGRGFHATATVGSFGSAAACSHLLGLDVEKTAHAFGIAGTQAAGLKSMFGTMCKPLHAGKAAQNGLMGALLASRGFDSRADVLECDQGFASTQSETANAEAALASPPEGYHLRSNLFKYHAACYLTHAAIECGRQLRERYNIKPDGIVRAVLRGHPTLDSVCNLACPESGLQAKFSLRLTTAMALAGFDTGALATYNDKICAHPDLVTMRDKIEVEFVSGWPQTKCELILTLEDGTEKTTTHDSGIPERDLSSQGKRLSAKFHGLVDPLLGAKRSQEVASLIGRLEELEDLQPLLKLCC